MEQVKNMLDARPWDRTNNLPPKIEVHTHNKGSKRVYKTGCNPISTMQQTPNNTKKRK